MLLNVDIQFMIIKILSIIVCISFCHLYSDAISESRPRAIDDSRARKMATDLKRCSYYETCATYGLNVERVFQDGKSDYKIFVIVTSKKWFTESDNFQMLLTTQLGPFTLLQRKG